MGVTGVVNAKNMRLFDKLINLLVSITYVVLSDCIGYNGVVQGHIHIEDTGRNTLYQ